MPTRRSFCLAAAATLLSTPTPAQFPGVSSGPTRLNLAEIDRDRILAAAQAALTRPPTDGSHIGDQPTDDFLNLTLDIPALAAANFLAPDPRYTAHALDRLTEWFITRATCLDAEPDTIDTVLQTAALAEVAVAIPFLGLAPRDVTGVSLWFKQYLTWLTESRTGLLARDNKDHIASSWLLQVAAFARFIKSDPPLTEAAHRFKTSTIRTQINRDGFFPNELPTPNPFRLSLLNLDLLAGACVLLSTRFDSVWDHELQDGPGMRAAVAFHAPIIAKPSTWPYPSDKSHFHELPCRRPALLFAARAYSQPDYAAIWRTLTPAQPAAPELLRAFPIRQPLLWQSQPRFQP